MTMRKVNLEMIKSLNVKLEHVYVERWAGELGIFQKGSRYSALNSADNWKEVKRLALKEDNFFKILKLENEFLEEIGFDLYESINDVLTGMNLKELVDYQSKFNQYIEFYKEHWVKYYSKLKSE